MFKFAIENWELVAISYIAKTALLIFSYQIYKKNKVRFIMWATEKPILVSILITFIRIKPLMRLFL